MCQLHFIKKMGKPITERELDLLYNAMEKGAETNKDGWGVFSNKFFFKINNNKPNKKDTRAPDFIGSSFLVGHNRLSTSGGNTIKATHPVEAPLVLVAHNGVVSKLGDKDESDTQAIARLVNEHYAENKNPAEAIKSVVENNWGSYSIFFFFRDSERLFYYKNSTTDFKFGLFKNGEGEMVILGSTYISNFKESKELFGFTIEKYPFKKLAIEEPKANALYEISDKGFEIVETLYYCSKSYKKNKGMRKKDKDGYAFSFADDTGYGTYDDYMKRNKDKDELWRDRDGYYA